MLVAEPKTQDDVRLDTEHVRRAKSVGRGASSRRCAVHRVDRPVTDLIRFVADPDGVIVPDIKADLPGRGVWVSADRATVSAAVQSNAFSRSLKSKCVAQEDLADQAESLIKRRVLNMLSLANKAGAVVCGFTKTEIAMEKGRVVVLLHGADSAPDGCDKLSRKFAALRPDLADARQIVAILTTSELSLAIGRPNVVHAGLTETAMASAFLSEARRFERFSQNVFMEAAAGQRPVGSE